MSIPSIRLSRAGDVLVMLNGEYVVVEKVQHELLENPVAIYNFEVEGFHTYYVGDTEVLVHNMCKKVETLGVDELEMTHGRTMGRNKFDKFVKEVAQNGIIEPIEYVAYNGKNYIVNGHHRFLAAKKLGMKSVPVKQVSLPHLNYRNIDDLIYWR